MTTDQQLILLRWMVSDACNKLKTFDDDVEEVQRKLAVREQTGKKVPMSREHGNYVKICTQEKRVKPIWISTNDNISEVMTKPLPRDTHKLFIEKIMNIN